MKTQIQITGQVGGNRTLLFAIQTSDCEVENHFQNYTVKFKTKKEAAKALSTAYQDLKSDKEDWDASCGSYTRGMNLAYDASRAYIVNESV